LPGTPRTDPYVRDYLTRLLPRVGDDQPLVGIRMKDFGFGKPPPRQTSKSLSFPYSAFLASPPQDAPPESLDQGTEHGKASEVPGERMVVEPTAYHGTEPAPHLDQRVVHALPQLLLKLLQCRSHALGNRFALDGERPLPCLPANVREAKDPLTSIVGRAKMRDVAWESPS
jgi:hypothetical protein